MSLQVDHITVPEDTLSSGQAFAYGPGSIANNLLGSTIGHRSIALDVGRGMNPALVGTRQVNPRFTNAQTDPVMGGISDNTRSRYDRCRPYNFIGAVVAVLDFSSAAFCLERSLPEKVDKYQIYNYATRNFSAFLNGIVISLYWWFRLPGGGR